MKLVHRAEGGPCSVCSLTGGLPGACWAWCLGFTYHPHHLRQGGGRWEGCAFLCPATTRLACPEGALGRGPYAPAEPDLREGARRSLLARCLPVSAPATCLPSTPLPLGLSSSCLQPTPRPVCLWASLRALPLYGPKSGPSCSPQLQSFSRKPWPAASGNPQRVDKGEINNFPSPRQL